MTKYGKIVENTGFLYVRMVVLALVDILSVRLVLSALGVSGYGVYSAVTGVALLFTTVMAVMEATAHRFISCELGLRNREISVDTVFATVLSMSVGLAVIAVLLGETVGINFVRMHLPIPEDFAVVVPLVFRMGEAMVVLKLLQLPFAALIYSSERMAFLAKVSFLEAGLILAAAFAARTAAHSGLTVYAVLMGLETGCVLLAHVVYCRRLFPSVCLRVRLGTVRIWEMGRFLAWSCLSALGNLLKYRGLTVVLSIYAGVAFNSTWEAAIRVGCLLTAVSVGFQQASAPSIYKYWVGVGSDEFSRHLGRILLVSVGLAALPAVGVMVWSDEMMQWWLGTDVPPQIVAFVQCVSINVVTDAASSPLTTCILASGRVALYHGMAFAFSALGFAMAWVLLAVGCAPWTAFAAVVASNAMAAIYRWLHVRRLLQVSLSV